MAKKQLDIPGTERETIKAIETAADEYQDLKEKRAKLLSKEIAAKAKLHELMKKHEKKTYRCVDNDLLVELVVTEEKVKVKHVETDQEAAEVLSE